MWSIFVCSHLLQRERISSRIKVTFKGKGEEHYMFCQAPGWLSILSELWQSLIFSNESFSHIFLLFWNVTRYNSKFPSIPYLLVLVLLCTFQNLFPKLKKWGFPVNKTVWTLFPAPLQCLYKWKGAEKILLPSADHMQVIYLRSHSELFAREAWFSLLAIWLKLSLNMFGNLQVVQENIWECPLFLKYLFWLITEGERSFLFTWHLLPSKFIMKLFFFQL